MSKYIFIVIVLAFYFLSLNASDELLGIPEKFDPEYVKSDDYPYFTLDSVLSTFYDETKFNTNISTIGYIGKDSSFPLQDGYLLLQRVFVTCCIAHANPVTIYIKPNGDVKLDENQWIKINGKVVGITNQLGTSPCIIAERIEKIPLPHQPYLNCDACPTEH